MSGDWLSHERMEEVEQYVQDVLVGYGCTGFPESWHMIEGLLADNIRFYKGEVEYHMTVEGGYNDRIGFAVCTGDLKYIVVHKIWIPYTSDWKYILKQLLWQFQFHEPRNNSSPMGLSVADMEEAYKKRIEPKSWFSWKSFGLGAASATIMSAIYHSG